MNATARGPIRVFLSYAHADARLKQEFEVHLTALKHLKIIAFWSDADIRPGQEWQADILKQLNEADLILLLVSHNLLASEFVRVIELPLAQKRHEAGEATVVPIILHECSWTLTWLSQLQALPPKATPVAAALTKARRNAAWAIIVAKIHATAEDLARSPPVAEQRVSLPSPDQYLVSRAKQYGDFFTRPRQPPDLEIGGYEEVGKLRNKLLQGAKVQNPILLTVRGTLFPCALLTSGWWERQVADTQTRRAIVWRDDVQSWLFNGFDLWAPSWDFTWVLDAEARSEVPSRFVAQLGTGDEADSLPVFVPPSLARRLRGHFDNGWGGMEVQVTGLLGHRRHFKKHFQEVDCFGGLLDFCMWVDDEANEQGIIPIPQETALYSGYVWKCLAPAAIVRDRGIRSIQDVFFVWDHTNFAHESTVRYSLDALENKEAYLRGKYGDLVLIQKSSSLVPGICKFSTQGAFNIITGRSLIKI